MDRSGFLQRLGCLLVGELLIFSNLGLSAPYSGYGEGSVPAETIAKFAAPQLPKDVKSMVQKYLDVRAPGVGLPSPDGKRIYFTWSVTGVTQIWTMNGPETFPKQLTGGEDTTYPVDITPDGKFIVSQRDEGGKEAPGIFLQSVDGGALRTVYLKDKVVASYEFTTDDGKFIVFRANDIKPDSYAIYRYEMSSGKIELIFSEDGIWSVADHKADGTLLLTKHRGNFAEEVFEWSPSTRKLTAILGQDENFTFTSRYGANAGELLVQTEKFGEFQSLYSFKAGKFQRIIPDIKGDVMGFDIDHPKRRITYNVNDQGYIRLLALDAKTLKPLKLPDFKGAYKVQVGGWSRNGRFMTLGIEGAKAPRTGYMFDWDTQKLTRWSTPSVPEIDAAGFADATLEVFPARDGTKIPMFVRRPRSCVGPCPVVVHFHGGPEGQSMPGFSLYAQLFVDSGFIFAEPNMRGSTGYGKTYRDADNAAKRLEVLSDIEDCAKFIRASWTRDGKEPKVGIMGGSYGGYATLAGMTKFAGAYDAGVSIVGIGNLVTFLTNTAPYRRILRVSEYGDLVKDKEALEKLSPSNFIDQVKSPLLVIQGANDPRVPVGEAVQMYEALEKKNIPARLIIFPDEGHGSAKRENKVLEIGHTIRFFRDHLSDKPVTRGE